MPRCLPMLTSFFDRFLMGFCSQLRPPEPHGSSPRCSESTIYLKIVFRNLFRSFIDLGANKPPFSLQKCTKTDLKIDRERHQFFNRFLHRFFVDFGSILEANLASKGSPWKGVPIANFALGPFQTPPKTRLTARTRPDDETGPKMNPPTSKMCPISTLKRLKSSPRCFFSGGFAALWNGSGRRIKSLGCFQSYPPNQTRPLGYDL